MFRKLIRNKSLPITQLALLMLLCAQLASIQHQAEHSYHEHSSHCEIFFKFDNTHANLVDTAPLFSTQTFKELLTATTVDAFLTQMVLVTSRDPPLA